MKMAGHKSQSVDLEANPQAAAVCHLYTHTQRQRLMSCDLIPWHLIMLGPSMYN
jgi:hypothetical protein